MRRISIVLIVIFISIFDGPTVYSAEREANHGCRCFLGRPSPRCCSFFLIDGAYLLRVGESNFRSDSKEFLIAGEVGYMFNRGSNWALGGGLYFGGDDDASRYALRPRVRRWVDRQTALDVSAGVIFAGSDNRVEIKPPGFTASASIGMVNWFSLTVGFEAIRIGPKENWPDVLAPGTDPVWRTGAYMGGTGSHWVAFAMPIVLSVIVAATWDDGFE